MFVKSVSVKPKPRKSGRFAAILQTKFLNRGPLAIELAVASLGKCNFLHWIIKFSVDVHCVFWAGRVVHIAKETSQSCAITDRNGPAGRPNW